jgi:ribonuclease HI
MIEYHFEEETNCNNQNIYYNVLKKILPNKLQLNVSEVFIVPKEVNIQKILDLNDNQFEVWCRKQYVKLWDFLKKLMKIFKRSKFKIDETRKIEDELKPYNIIAFIDGSCVKDHNNVNFGKVGYGFLLSNKNTKEEFQIYGEVKNDDLIALQNVGGELFAAIEAIKLAISKNYKSILIAHDYWGVSEYACRKWHSNIPAIKKYSLTITKLRVNVDIQFIKVPAHSGIDGNEKADELAKYAVGLVKDNLDKIKKQVNVSSEEEVAYYKKLYRIIFKICVLTEMIFLNNNLNNLDIDLLILNLNLKWSNIEDLLNKQLKVMELLDVDLTNPEYNDLICDD